jgi:integrase
VSAIVPTSPASLAATIAESALRYASQARSPRTRAAYAREQRAFAAWCQERSLPALPTTGAVLASYIAALADRGIAPASIDLALAAVSAAHEAGGYPSPRSSVEVRTVRKGLRRARGTAQRQAAAVTPTEFASIVGALPDDLHGLRDRAILLLGFATAVRRSELVALDVEDLRFTADGLEVAVRRSKTDQEGKGRVVGVHRGARALTCPVRATQAWLAAAGLTSGPAFRGFAGRGSSRLTERLGDRDVARVLQRAAMVAGIDASRLSGHSLRAGFATAAARAGALRSDICEVTGHKATGKMVDRYIRAGERFARNPLAGVL